MLKRESGRGAPLKGSALRWALNPETAPPPPANPSFPAPTHLPESGVHCFTLKG